MKKISLLILLSFCFSVFYLFYFPASKAQNNSPGEDLTRNQSRLYSKQSDKLKQVAQTIKNSKSAGAVFERRNLFQSAAGKATDDAQLREVVGDGVILNLDKPAIQKILRENVEFLTLPLPDGKGGTVELELAKVNIFAPGFSVKTSQPTSETVGENSGAHYRGIVKGDDHSLVAISIFKNEVMGFYSTETQGNAVLGRLGGNNPAGRHILYAEKDLKVRPGFHCETTDDGVRLPASALQEPDEIVARCVKIYLEVNYDLYVVKGGVTEASNYVTGVFNQSATLLSNDGIPVTISEIFVWTSPSPYNGIDSRDQLVKFQSYRTSFNGDLAHLLSSIDDFGGAAFISALCNPSTSYAFSGIKSFYENVPTYSEAVFVFTHETGHNLGSPHTHACAWNGDNTAIDSCGPTAGYPYEGGCGNAPQPTNGGTIMSYCHLVPGVGINFSLGFGTQPRNLIVNRFDNAYCLSDCATNCSYQLSPVEATFAAAGGNGSFSVTTGSACAWTAAIYQPSTLGISSFLQTEKLFPAAQASTAEKMPVSVQSAPGTIFPNSSLIATGDENLGSGWLTITSGTSGTGNGTITYSIAINTSESQRSSRILVGNRLHTVRQNPVSVVNLVPYDFDGDQKSDISVFRPSNGYWYINNSSNSSLTQTQFGASGDLLAPADFDGDAKTDVSVFRPSDGVWYRLGSLNNTFSATQFGTNGDLPVPANYDGDTKADLAVYRPSAGIWYWVSSSTNAFVANQFGSAGDKPVIGDYDGDGQADLAVYRPTDGTWYLLRTRNGFAAVQFGNSTDKPVVGDFDGDNKDDLAVYRPSDGTWYLLRSSQGYTSNQFGNSTDVPAPADYDGDGKTDLAVYRGNTWYLLQSTQGFVGVQFGATGDKPVPGSLVP
jgi:hypothetical protein